MDGVSVVFNIFLLQTVPLRTLLCTSPLSKSRSFSRTKFLGCWGLHFFSFTKLVCWLYQFTLLASKSSLYSRCPATSVNRAVMRLSRVFFIPHS